MITIYVLIFTFIVDHKLANQEKVIHSLLLIVVNDKFIKIIPCFLAQL